MNEERRRTTYTFTERQGEIERNKQTDRWTKIEVRGRVKKRGGDKTSSFL